jgi:hypothetical protein
LRPFSLPIHFSKGDFFIGFLIKNTPRLSTNPISSPGDIPSFSLISFGIVICPLEVTFAVTL